MASPEGAPRQDPSTDEIERRTEVVGIFPNEADGPPRGRDPARAEQRVAVERVRYMSLETIAPMREDLNLMLQTAAA